MQSKRKGRGLFPHLLSTKTVTVRHHPLKLNRPGENWAMRRVRIRTLSARRGGQRAKIPYQFLDAQSAEEQPGGEGKVVGAAQDPRTAVTERHGVLTGLKSDHH